ncbi:MAG: low-specificity L-threonine aldolase [Pseudohongiella nitratireducens]|nr:low-specificity L-threonine aldolase [Pseudohongiella nitratireducens]MDF1623500.1 low-specificity L-threonine aldolase [Pseudohongiella nitratireducens]
MSNSVIDLRSDTVTRPGKAMRDAMYQAAVGDDVWGEDPTVIQLESRLAEMSGKAAGLFLPSGTQSNLVALLSHCQRGDEYIVGQDAHTYRYEGGGAAVLGGIQPQPMLMQASGELDLEQVEALIKPDDFHFARTRLLALENTVHGKVLSPDYIRQASEFCEDHNIGLHLDGARLFNAVVKTGCGLADYTRPVDSVSICLSKGLGAPVGSVLLGNHEFITNARRWRKVTGGGMRQAGILAAAGLYALEHNIDRLADDHRRAAWLAEQLKDNGYSLTPPQTNMIFLEAENLPRKALSDWLEKHGVMADCLGRDHIRLVTHLDISDADIERVAEVFTEFTRQHRL